MAENIIMILVYSITFICIILGGLFFYAILERYIKHYKARKLIKKFKNVKIKTHEDDFYNVR